MKKELKMSSLKVYFEPPVILNIIDCEIDKITLNKVAAQNEST
jgi:hypothetical protein